jgi:hypothetical protein
MSLRRTFFFSLIPALALMSGSAPAASTMTLKGVLIDDQCSSKAEVRLVPGPRIEGGLIVAEAHTRECLLMPACQKSGYGIFTLDNKYVKFDAAGSKKALDAIKASKSLDNLSVEVTGAMQGDAFKVETLKLTE